MAPGFPERSVMTEVVVPDWRSRRKSTGSREGARRAARNEIVSGGFEEHVAASDAHRRRGAVVVGLVAGAPADALHLAAVSRSHT